MSSTQTLSRGGELQEGKARSSSPMTALVSVAHPGTHPIHLPPPPMVAEVTLEGKGYSRGRCPVNRFPWMVTRCKLLRFSTHRGNSPDSWLSPRNILCKMEMPPSSDGIGPVRLLLARLSHERVERFPSSGGIGPVRLLLLRNTSMMLERFPSWGGIDPVRRLVLRYSCWRLERFPSWGGIDPVRRLALSCSTQSLERFPSSGGIDPVRLLLVMDRTCNSVRFPNSAGSLPFSGFPPGRRGDRVEMNLILVTRDGVPDTVIPCQLDIAVVAFQLRGMVPRNVSFPAQRFLQSAMRPVFV